jgi:hypothetical protein
MLLESTTGFVGQTAISISGKGRVPRMHPTERRDFREIVIAACCHVLPQCALPIHPDPAPLDVSIDPAEHLAAFIGFTTGSLRGAVTLIVPASLLRASYPLALKHGIDGQLELFDWAGEIVNRLLGRVKSGLGTRGVAVEPSTPKTMMGEQIQFVVSEHSSVCALRFQCREASLAVLVDAISAEDQTLFRASQGAIAFQPEGELLLF